MGKLKIGARLRELRESKGVSQVEVGKAIGVSKKSMSCYENDAYTPPLEILEKLSNYYDTSIDYIIRGKVIGHREINITDKMLLESFEEIDSFDLTLKKSLDVVLKGFILGYKK